MNPLYIWCQLPYLIGILIIIGNPFSEAWDVSSPAGDGKQCGELYFQSSFQGSPLLIKDDEQFSDLTDILHYFNIEKENARQSLADDEVSGNEIVQSSKRDPISFRVQEGCRLKLSPTNYLKDDVHVFSEDIESLDEFVPGSAACECPKVCKCEDNKLRRSECARAYLDEDCTNCKALFTTMKPTKSWNQFPERWSSSVNTIVLKEGCDVSLRNAGHSKIRSFSSKTKRIIKDIQQLGNITQYLCKCSEAARPQQESGQNTKRPNENDPPLLNIPKSKGGINTLLFNDELKTHPGLMAALQSLRNKRSSKNAYILLLGLTGSGKSSAVNLLFDHPNITKVGDFVSTTTDILQFSIPVPVQELGMNNTALHVIDTPGIADTRGIAEDARFLASLDDFLSKHEDLRRNLPNVVLIFSKFSDNRYRGDGANFVKMLRTIDLFKDKIIDKKATNVIFVLTHYMSETKDITRDPSERIQSIRNVIQEFSTLPRPIHIVLAENKPEESHLPSINGFYRLPNGEFYPKNLFDQMQRNLVNSGDPVGNAVIRSAFSNSDNFQIFGKRTRLLHKSNAKVTRYLGLLASFNIPVSGTEVSTELNKAYEELDPELKSKYSDALNILQRSLFLRNILQLSDLPQSTSETLKLLENIQINPATIQLLQNALNITVPEFKGNYIVGSGYSLISDSILPSKIFNTEINTNDLPSDLIFRVPGVYQVGLLNQLDNQFQVVTKMQDFIKYRMNALGLSENTIPFSEYKSLPEEHPGFNLISLSEDSSSIPEEMLWNSLTATVDYHTFYISLSKHSTFSDEFSIMLGQLEKLDLSDSTNVAKWQQFFEIYGTHVVTNAYGGGSIKVTVKLVEEEGKSNNEKFSILGDTMANVMQELANELIGKDARYEPPEGVTYSFSQKGGDHKYYWSNFSELDDTKNIDEWRDSLKYEPIVLTSKLQLVPISEIVKELQGNQEMSFLIEEAAATLLNASLLYIPVQRLDYDENSPESRDKLNVGTSRGTGDFESMQEFSNMFKMISESNQQMQHQLAAIMEESQRKREAQAAKYQQEFLILRQEEAEKEQRRIEQQRYDDMMQLEREKLEMERLAKENALRAQMEQNQMQLEMQQRLAMEEIRSKNEQTMLNFLNMENERRNQIAMNSKGVADKIMDSFGQMQQTVMSALPALLLAGG